MILGIGTYCYMWAIGFQGAQPEKPLTALGLLGKARELGVHLVQIGPNLPLNKLSDVDLSQFIRKASEWKIELELGTRGLETDHLNEQVLLARRIGGKLLRTIPEIDGKPMDYRDIPPYLRAILPVLEKENIKLGMENGKIPAKDLCWALDQVRSPYLGIILDTVNSLAVPEGWKYVAEVLALHTICLHHKDFTVQRVWNMMGFTVQGRPAGKGQLDTAWLLDTLKAAGAKFNVILEVWPPEQKTLQETIDLEDAWVKESVPYLRTLIQD